MLYKVDISQFGQHSVKSLCCHSQWGNIKLVLAIEQKNLGIKKGECGNINVEKDRQVQVERMQGGKAGEPSKETSPEYKIICQESLCF